MTSPQIAKARAMYDMATNSRTTITASIEKLQKEQEIVDVALALAQKVAVETQEQIKFNIEDIVNLALDTVFPDRYKFQLLFETKRKRTEARPVLFDGEHEIDPLDSTGGGLSDTLAFALRIALLIISRNRKVLILDEAVGAVSKGYKPKMYEIMKRLSTDLGIQIIAVTHDENMVEIADTVYTVEKEGKVSNVRRNY
jgi:DNA repair exonuclease SbcCD ATPase subunit